MQISLYCIYQNVTNLNYYKSRFGTKNVFKNAAEFLQMVKINVYKYQKKLYKNVNKLLYKNYLWDK